MDVNASSWLVILLAVMAANLPFVNEKAFCLVPLKTARKPFAMRLAELAVLYAAIGGIGMALESRIGTVFPQTWEFYWVAAFAFLVFAFPGFVVRYLRKHR
ncbi:DUF2818 family protein [Pseudoduganella violaceinigra]|uniref:DUF2818 family protein n=1 Tax=Pseudoduganella violaceinigra TaxID=246602 RepID=UPI00041331CC|nr:DUF2818 family protein [Pseudoduganella violaceinigra]